MKNLLLSSALMLTCAMAHADIHVEKPWVRATVAQQQATGAFMQISSTTAVRLVSASSPVARQVEIHEMKMEGDVMKMRQVSGLDIPAGQAVALSPGGYHIMFMGLKQTVKDGDIVPLQLVFESAGHAAQTIEVNAPARPLNATAEKTMQMPMQKHGQ